jgi:integrase
VRGTLTELGEGHWRLRVFSGRNNGRTRHISRNFKGSRRQAQTALSKLVADVERRQVVAGHTVSLGELLERWLEAIQADRSLYTVREYSRMIERNVKPALGSVSLDKLTARHLDDFYRQLHDRGLSASSIRRHHSLLHASLHKAVQWELLLTNPADRATPPRRGPGRVSVPTVGQVALLMAEAEQRDPALAAAIAIGSVTGARRGELAALRWSDVDLEAGTLRIARALTVIKGQVSEGATKTHQVRTISVDGALAGFLAHRRAQQQEHADLVGVQLAKDAFVLSPVADGSAPYMPDRITDNYRNLARRLGVPGHIHELRHFSATLAIVGGSDLRTVAGRLGHAQTSTTLNIYSHLLEARDKELAQFLGQAVLGRPGSST